VREDTDTLHSSRQMEIAHFGEKVYRLDKFRAIVGEPIVRENLRGCWAALNDRMNCSRCEKCLRTMVWLAGVGELKNT